MGNNKTELARYYNENGELVTVTIEKYKNMVEHKEKEKIADFIYNRLYSRYIKPFEYDDLVYKQQYKNGFSMMANCCLLIETFQAFREEGDKGSEYLFKNFFENNKQFKDFDKTEKMNGNIKNSFYIHVRCGILHQGETRGGWKINRKPDTPLLDNKNINANKFMEELKKVLEKYRNDLSKADFDNDDIWKKFKNKMDDIINNCQ